jgi:hypothetical protein
VEDDDGTPPDGIGTCRGGKTVTQEPWDDDLLSDLSPEDVDAINEALAQGRDPAGEYAAAGEPDEVWEAHALLLQLAGRIPDDVLSQARYLLTVAPPVRAFRGLARALVRSATPLTVAESLALARFFDRLTFARAMPRLTLVDGRLTVPTPCDFTPFRPGTRPVPKRLADGADAWGLDLTGPEPAPEGDALALDATDDRLVEAVAAVSGAAGLWRAWRFWLDGAPLADGEDGLALRRVYLVTVAGDGPGPAGSLHDNDLLNRLPEIAWELQVLGTRDGEELSVEVGPDLPGSVYHDRLASRGALLWSRRPARAINVITHADLADPSLRDPEQRLDAHLRERLVTYLDSAREVFVESSTSLPSPDPDFDEVVIHTDGSWVWPGTLNRGLEAGILVPPPGLLAHLGRALARDDEAPATDGPTAHRAMRAYLTCRLE